VGCGVDIGEWEVSREIDIEGVANGSAEGLRIVRSIIEGGRCGRRWAERIWIKSSRVPAEDFSRN